MKLNGKEYKFPEIKSFADIVRLESKGVKLLALIDGGFFDKENLATSLVRGFSYFTGLSFEEALNEVSESIDNGESIESLINSLLEDVNSIKESGAAEGFSKGAKAPQDHKKVQKK